MCWVTFVICDSTSPPGQETLWAIEIITIWLFGRFFFLQSLENLWNLGLVETTPWVQPCHSINSCSTTRFCWVCLIPKNPCLIQICYVARSWLHTLWLFNIAMGNGPFMPIYRWFTYWKWWFSMAMSNNQMVVLVCVGVPSRGLWLRFVSHLGRAWINRQPPGSKNRTVIKRPQGEFLGVATSQRDPRGYRFCWISSRWRYDMV